MMQIHEVSQEELTVSQPFPHSRHDAPLHTLKTTFLPDCVTVCPTL